MKWLVMLITFFFTVTVDARPDMTPLGANIADKGSAFYHFSRTNFSSADGKRHYRVWIAVPNSVSPAAGFPVLYMLDGNAVMDRLSDTLLKKLVEQDPPVLIIIGYQTALPFDLPARTYDYTPIKNNPDEVAEHKPGWRKGGSAVFRHLLEKTIAPQVEHGLKVNTARRGIWGHSYGGLFVLDSYQSSRFFSLFYAASPSLSQGYSFLTHSLLSVPRANHKSLTLMEGEGEVSVRHRGKGSDGLAIRNMIASLRQKGVQAQLLHWPGQSHGQMFNVSFQAAMLDMTKSNDLKFVSRDGIRRSLLE